MRQRPLLQPPGFPASYLNLPKIKKQGCPITHTLKVCNRPHNIALASFDPRQNDWPLISGPRSGLVYLNGIWIICLLVQKQPNTPKFEKRTVAANTAVLFFQVGCANSTSTHAQPPCFAKLVDVIDM